MPRGNHDLSTIDRPRVRSLLDERWTRRVVTLVAGAGFGKSTAIAQALSRPGVGIDHLIALDERHASYADLLRLLGDAIGAPVRDADELLEHLDRIDGERCIVIDDLHLLVEAEAGAADTIRRLVTSASPRIHFVLSSRQPLPVRLARLRASGQVVDIDETLLAYSDDELKQVADAHGLAKDILAEAGGWPALVTLTAAAGHRGAIDFLTEEVIDGLTPKLVQMLTVAVLAGTATPTLLQAVLGDVPDVHDLASQVPMVTLEQDGAVTPHALWRAAIERHVFSDERRRHLHSIAAHRRAIGDHRGAIQAAIDGGDVYSMSEVVRDIGQLGHIALNIDEIDRWLDVAPSAFADTPEGRLLAAISVRARNPFGIEARDRLQESWQEFRELGIVGCEVVAMSELAFVHRARGEPAQMMPIVGRLLEMEAQGEPSGRPFATFARAAIAEQLGDVDGALATLDELRPGDLSDGWMALVEFQRCNHLLLQGRPREALEAARRSTELGGSGYLGGWCAQLSAKWHLGVDRDLLDQLPVADEIASTSLVDRIWVGSWFGAFQAFAGRVDLAARNISVARSSLRADSQPELVGFVAWAEAVYALVEGDTERAVERLESFVATHPIDSPIGLRLASRSPAVFALLLPAHRDTLRGQLRGAWQQQMLDVAEALVELRSGDASRAWPDPSLIMCALPLPWAVELAQLGLQQQHDRAGELADHLGAVVPDAVANLSAGTARWGAAPADVVRVDLLGPVRITGVDLTVDEFRRRRVRELLVAVALDGPVARESVAVTLWPELDGARSSRNLRVNLSYLGRVRAGGSRLVEQEAGSLRLRPDVGTDVQEFARLTQQALAAARAGALGASLERYERALELVRGRPLSDTCSEDWFERESTRLTWQILDVADRATTVALQLGEHERAASIAERSLRLDEYHEPAHVALVDALLASGDATGARRAADRFEAVLDGLGLRPTDEVAALLARSRRDDADEPLAPG